MVFDGMYCCVQLASSTSSVSLTLHIILFSPLIDMFWNEDLKSYLL